MAQPIHVPRVNNNDDEVTLVELKVSVGEQVKAGQVIASVETDKAIVDVEAPSEGFVLAIDGEVGARLTVGRVLVWLGSSADEAVPVSTQDRATQAGQAQTATPTAKARGLLREYGLQAADIPFEGARLGAEDVERHAAARGLVRRGETTSGRTSSPAEAPPEIAGSLKPLRSDQRGMLATVTWHRDVAVPGYIEISFDAAPWNAYAEGFQAQHGLLLNPLLPLLAWRLVQLAAERPQLNATIVGEQRHEYSTVNLGFTVQAGEVLYLAVTRNAAALGELSFAQSLIDLQRRAAAHNLGPTEISGTTIGFSSMSRWKVERHVPILAPHTSMMVAHTVGAGGQAVLGATYDHRVLHGADVVTALRKLAKPPTSA
ncbi:MAG: 2-oxo acid dehydrogenase subunit E2 [Rhizobacter sp.]